MPSTATPPPPMSTTSLPASAKPFRAPPPPLAVKPPILASDILREEVAPRAPARRAIRVSLLAFAATFAVAAVAARGLWGGFSAPLAFEGALATSAVALIAAVAPWPYAARAVLAVVAGLAPLALAAGRRGPLAPLGDAGPAAAVAFAVMATALPAALVFRGRYRAFRGARAVLALALAASGPALYFLGRTALDADADTVSRVLGALGIAGAAASTLGFMGPETSGGCTQWAGVVLGVLAAKPAWIALLMAWMGRGSDVIDATAAALGELIASTLVTFGLFQLLAAAFGGQARRVDVHRAVGPGASEPAPLPDRDL